MRLFVEFCFRYESDSIIYIYIYIYIGKFLSFCGMSQVSDTTCHLGSVPE